MAVASSARFTQAITSTAAVPFLFNRLKWTPLDYQQELLPITTGVTFVAYALGARLLTKRPVIWPFTLGSLVIAGLWIALGLAQPLWDQAGHPLIQGSAVLKSSATAIWTHRCTP